MSLRTGSVRVASKMRAEDQARLGARSGCAHRPQQTMQPTEDQRLNPAAGTTVSPQTSRRSTGRVFKRVHLLSVTVATRSGFGPAVDIRLRVNDPRDDVRNARRGRGASKVLQSVSLWRQRDRARVSRRPAEASAVRALRFRAHRSVAAVRALPPAQSRLRDRRARRTLAETDRGSRSVGRR
jgi:hypothetical protein